MHSINNPNTEHENWFFRQCKTNVNKFDNNLIQKCDKSEETCKMAKWKSSKQRSSTAKRKTGFELFFQCAAICRTLDSVKRKKKSNNS